ncbi:MAG: hypothetical protein CL885_03105, partial [Dehalococcoidia bacterium]|nr:hypothetical protein [Dehalococcoidia bacterium]
MTPDLYITGLFALTLGATLLFLKNKKLSKEISALTKQDADLRERLKEEYERFDASITDLKDQIKFKNERLEDWSKSEHLRVKELSQDKLDLKERLGEKDKKITEIHKELTEEKEARKKVLSQKKSGEVRLGHIAEKLAPFLEGFTYDPA